MTHTTRALLFAGALLMGTACSPQEYIAQFFGPETHRATQIAECESNMDPGAVSHTNDHGLFQINGLWRGTYEEVTGQSWSATIYDPFWNTRFAWWLYEREGWNPWVCDRIV